MKLVNVTVIPAEAGTRLIHKLDTSYDVSLTDLLAWRIETFEAPNGVLKSDTYPISVDGDGDTAVGVVAPNQGSVTLFEDQSFASFDDFLDEMHNTRREVLYPADWA